MSFVYRLAAFVLTATLLGPAVAVAQTPEHTLSVVGRGQVELRPDRGNFTAGVTRLSPSANTARSRTNSQVKAIVTGLRGLGVSREQITTSEISIVREKRRIGKDGPVRTRFRASVALRVAVDGLERLGRAIDAASRRGATAIYGPQLSFSPALRATGRLRSEAAALQDARTRAEAAAATENQRIVGVQSIDLDPSQDGFSTFSLDSAASAGRARQSPTQVFAAKRKLTSEARVTYIMEPAV